MIRDATAESAATEVLDPSDVPAVGARELAQALKLLAGPGSRFPATDVTEGDLRGVEQAFWQLSPRHRTRKAAVLLRLRCFVEAARARRVRALLERGDDAVSRALDVAAAMRLNARWGFNPHKLARAVAAAQAQAEPAPLPLAA